MVELILEMLLYLALAALAGLLLGYLFWGWGTAARISAARADGAAAARTSVDGSAGLREQLQEAEEERIRQAEEIERLMDELARRDPQEAGSMQESRAVFDGPDTDVPPAKAPEPETTASETMEQFRTSMFRRPSRATSSVASAEDKTAKDSDGSADDTVSSSGEAVDRASLEDAKENVSPSVPTELQVSGQEAESDASTVDASEPSTPRGLLSERPDAVDDLKKIKGVGKVMEGVLNDKGIYLFRQLAWLNEQEVDWVNDAIEAFPGRIHRDKWVEQAKDLYQQKYGQPFDHED